MFSNSDFLKEVVKILLISAILLFPKSGKTFPDNEKPPEIPKKIYGPGIYLGYRPSVKTLFSFDEGYFGAYNGFMASFRSQMIINDERTYFENGDLHKTDKYFNYEKLDKTKSDRGSITFTYLNRLSYHLWWYAGGGYGWKMPYICYNEYYYTYKDHGFETWVQNRDAIERGIETEAGIMLNFKKLYLNTGLSTLNLKNQNLIYTFGVGFLISP